jgi:uncharacterized protein YcfJ
MNSNATTTARLPTSEAPRTCTAVQVLGLAAAAFAMLPGQSWAGRYDDRHDDRQIDRARVVESRPVVQRVVEPRRECTSEVVHQPVRGGYRPLHAGDLVGPVVGGVAGGAIGSQIGGGSGRTAATVAGAVAGTIAGSVLLPPQSRPYGPPHGSQVAERVVERCRTVNYTRDVVRGYDVTYRYQGRFFTTRMPYDPGRFVQVDVSRGAPGWSPRRVHAEPAVVIVDRGYRDDRRGRGRHQDDDD